MSDENTTEMTAHEAADVSDPQADIMALSAEIVDLRRKLEKAENDRLEIEYQMQINGGLARLNVAGLVLGGLYARKGVAEEDEIGHIEQAERVADKIVSRFEAFAEKRASEWVKQQSKMNTAMPASSAEN